MPVLSPTREALPKLFPWPGMPFLLGDLASFSSCQVERECALRVKSTPGTLSQLWSWARRVYVG